jgi:tRNA(adenine34) deaminase
VYPAFSNLQNGGNTLYHQEGRARMWARMWARTVLAFASLLVVTGYSF